MATYTVGTSGADYTSVSAAMAVTTASDTIQLITDVSNTFNAITGSEEFLEITTDGPMRTWEVSHSVLYITGSNINHAITISNIRLHTRNSNRAVVTLASAGGTSFHITFENCILEENRDVNYGSGEPIFYDTWSTVSSRVVFNQCWLKNHWWAGDRGAIAVTLNSAEGAVIVKNTVISGGDPPRLDLNIAHVYASATTSNKVIHLLNCTFFQQRGNCYLIGLIAGPCDYKVENCLFIDTMGGSYEDINITGNVTKADIKNCYFHSQVDTGGYDASNKFGSVDADEVVNPPALKTSPPAYDYDMSLLSTAISRNAGKTIASVTTDIVEISRPQGSNYDIGAYEYPVISYPFEKILVERETDSSVNIWGGLSALSTGVIIYYGSEVNPTSTYATGVYTTTDDNGRQWYKTTFAPSVVSGFYFRGVGGGSGYFEDQLANIPLVSPTETPAYTTANISWNIPNVATSGDVYYGATQQTYAPVYANYSYRVIGSASGINQSAQLTGLIKDATSYYSILSNSLDYQFAYIYANDSFVTLADPLGYLSGWPTNLTALSQNGITLSWDAPSYRYASGLNSGYRVYRAYAYGEVMKPIGCTYDTIYIDSGVERDRDYFYRITTVFGD